MPPGQVWRNPDPSPKCHHLVGAHAARACGRDGPRGPSRSLGVVLARAACREAAAHPDRAPSSTLARDRKRGIRRRPSRRTGTGPRGSCRPLPTPDGALRWSVTVAEQSLDVGKRMMLDIDGVDEQAQRKEVPSGRASDVAKAQGLHHRGRLSVEERRARRPAQARESIKVSGGERHAARWHGAILIDSEPATQFPPMCGAGLRPGRSACGFPILDSTVRKCRFSGAVYTRPSTPRARGRFTLTRRPPSTSSPRACPPRRATRSD